MIVSEKPMRMKVGDVLEVAKNFVKKEAGYSTITVVSSEADEQAHQWRVTVEVGFIFSEKKEVIVDDRDGNIIGYRAVSTA